MRTNIITREYGVSWVSERRRHQSGGLVKFFDNTGDIWTDKDTYSVDLPSTTAPWTVGTSTQIGSFLYMTISGGASGTLFYSATDLAGNTPIAPISLNGHDLIISKIYGPQGGPGTGPSTIYVDAFNVTTGQFIDDDFVKVTMNGMADQMLSASINKDGVVVTTNSNNEHLMAFQTINSQNFVKWVNISKKSSEDNTPAGTDLGIARSGTGMYLAFYETPGTMAIPVGLKNEYATWNWVDPRDYNDGGPHPLNPEALRWTSGMAMATIARYAHPSLQKQFLELAAKQSMLSAEALSKSFMTKAKELEGRMK